MEVTHTQSNFNINQLNDNLLAGLYANGYTNLENINNELFNSILNWEKIFAKLDNSSTDSVSNNELSLITSVISSLINKKDGNILFVVSDTTQLEKYNSQFKKISSYIESVNTRTIQEDSNARLIVSDVTSINSNIENVKYIVVNNCITKRLVKNLKYKNVNIAFLSTEINDNVIENVKKITGEDTVESSTEAAVFELSTEAVVVESNTEAVVEESHTEAVVVESSTEAVVEESNTEAVVESNTEAAVEESKNEIELSTPIQRDEEIQSDSDSDYDLDEIISQLNIPSLSFQEAKKEKLKNHNKKLLLQMRSRGLRR